MLGHWEILIILLVAILVFGASRIPAVGRGLGEGFRNFRDALRGASSEPEQKTDAMDKAESKDDDGKSE